MAALSSSRYRIAKPLCGLCDLDQPGRLRTRWYQPRITAALSRAAPSSGRAERNKAAEVGSKWELFGSSPAGNGRAVPDRKGQCARDDGRCGRRSDGAAYRVAGHRPRRQTARSPTVGASSAGWCSCARRSTKCGNPIPTIESASKLANIAHKSFNVLTKYKVTGNWEIGGQAVYALEIYGGTFGAANRHRASALLALRCLRRIQDRQELTAKLYVQQHPRQACITTRSIAVRRRSCCRAGAVGSPGHAERKFTESYAGYAYRMC